jgi:inner membrane protein
MQLRIFLKLAILGGVSILMLIALASIKGISHEREQRLAAVQYDIARSYADAQLLFGPVVTVVCRETWTETVYDNEKRSWEKKENNHLNTVHLYPEKIFYDGALQVDERRRGIFKVNAFLTKGRIEGTIRFPALDTLRTKKDSSVELVSTDVSLYVSDPRGISQVSPLNWNGTPLDFQPGSSLQHNNEGIHVPISYTQTGEQPVAFSLELNIHGTRQFTFVPIGSNNRVHLTSPWPHPSFTGHFLPTERTISDDGFDAEWNVNALACSAQQKLPGGRIDVLQYLGVNLMDPISPYSLTDRALKYGFLFIFLTFAAFFLFEMIRQLKIHPIQYGFVGLAQAFFFLLLLSLSEHIGFGSSYLIAAVATIATITVYLCSVLRGMKRGLLFGGVLAAVYAVLYGLLLSEDHALVAGSTLIFGTLALVMILTRKLDWYALGRKPEGSAQ